MMRLSIQEKQVMIDHDLAEFYGVETKVFIQAVKRNMERFPEEFRFQLINQIIQVLNNLIDEPKADILYGFLD